MDVLIICHNWKEKLTPYWLINTVVFFHENLSIYIPIVSDIHTNSLNVQSLSFLDLVLQITNMIGSSIACHGDDNEFPPSNID